MRRSSFAQMLSFSVSLIASLTAVSAFAADLTVIVENVKSSEGGVRVGLFNNAASFPKIPLVGQEVDTKSAKANSVSVTFKNLSVGSYAVSAFHDLNGNHKIDKNFVGMPVEPYGFSNNARGMFGPPAFDEASINFGSKDLSISIKLK